MNFFQRIQAQLAEFWAGLSTVRRAMVIVAVGGVFLALLGFGYLQTATGTYVPLYSNLALEETAAIQTRLDTLAIPYRLEAGGTRVMVPQDRVAAAQVGLAAEGLPSRGGKGLELFDETSLGMTPFVQNVNLLRALQAELARSIMQLDPVQSARVLIARPDPTPFIRDQRPPTASVVIRLKPRSAMGRGMAASIVSLVSRSVEGLKPENVTVVDSNGRLLSDPHAGEREDLPTAQIEYRRELENYLSQKAEEMLSRHLGVGRAIVRVSADINFQKVKERRETYSPDEKVVSAERLTTTKTTAAPARGVAGAASNIQRAGGTQGGGGAGGSSEEVIQTDYLVSRTVRDMDDRMGAVTRLTIAALADLSPPDGGTSGQAAGPALSPEDASEIIKQAIGFKTGRDEIKLSNVKLTSIPTEPEPDEEALRLARIQAYVGIARNVSVAVAAALTLIIVVLLLVRRRKPPVPPPAAEPKLPEAAMADQRRKELLDRFAEMARAEPDKLAQVFSSLLGGGPPASPGP